MRIVTSLDIFKKGVVKIGRQKNTTQFHCYIQGDIFKISKVKKVQQFHFINLKSEKQICKFVDTSIHISYFTKASAGTITIIFRNKVQKELRFRKIESLCNCCFTALASLIFKVYFGVYFFPVVVSCNINLHVISELRTVPSCYRN